MTVNIHIDPQVTGECLTNESQACNLFYNMEHTPMLTNLERAPLHLIRTGLYLIAAGAITGLLLLARTLTRTIRLA